MPYWLETDTFADDDVWLELAGGRWGTPLYDRLKASYCDLKAMAARGMTNGYLKEQKALHYCRGKRQVLELLCASVLDLPPLIHRRGDECSCLVGEWVEGYEYRIHAFLKKNPARTETQRNQAQKADLKDARLKALVYERDGGCCRYCRSGPLNPKTNNRTKDRRKILHFDHVDPDKPAGPDGEGFVVACARCNEAKGHCTPDEADMVLLRAPGAAERAEWAARGLALFEREDWGPEHADIIGGSSVTSSPDLHPPDDPGDVRTDDADDDPGLPVGGGLRPETAGHTADHAPDQPGEGVGSGRVAEPHDRTPDLPPRKPPEHQPRRSSSDPDIYTRRSRASPPEHLGWPAGSYPVDRRPPPDKEETPWTN